MIKAVIIENDEDALFFIMHMIDINFPEITILDTAKTVKQGTKVITNHNPDLVLLDIELDDGLSFEILDNLKSRDFETVFISAFNCYYKEAFDHFALSYIIKPFCKENFIKVLSQFKKRRSQGNQHIYNQLRVFLGDVSPKILVQFGDSHESVLLKDIIYLKADGNYSSFMFENKKSLLANHGLKHYTSLLTPKGFFRANRFYLVNVEHLQSIYKKETLVLSNNEKVTVSARNRNNLKDLINTLK